MNSIQSKLCVIALLLAGAYACNTDKHETKEVASPASDTTSVRNLTIPGDTSSKTSAADSTRVDSTKK